MLNININNLMENSSLLLSRLLTTFDINKILKETKDKENNTLETDDWLGNR